MENSKLFDSNVKEYLLKWEVDENGIYCGRLAKKIQNQDGLDIGYRKGASIRKLKDKWSLFDSNHVLGIKATQPSFWKIRIYLTDSQEKVIGIMKYKGWSNPTILLLNTNGDEVLVTKPDYLSLRGQIKDPTNKTIAEYSTHRKTTSLRKFLSKKFTTKCTFKMKIFDESYDKNALLGLSFFIVERIVPTPQFLNLGA